MISAQDHVPVLYFDSHFCLCYRYLFSKKNSGEMKERAEIQEKIKKAKLYTRFPLSSLLIYNGTTILHYLLGGAGIIVGYNFSVLSVIFGYLYFTFSFLKMYVVFPLTVCPNCVYYRLENSLCISGLNVVAKVLAKEGKPDDFPKRSKGLLSSNNLYMATLLIPLIAIIPALILNFSFLLLVLFIGLVGLLTFRFFVIFPKIGCLHCRAKFKCPQAEAMGVRDL